MSSKTRCNQCGSSEIDRDPSRGDAVCTGCGFVLEESIIVSEVQFSQDSHGTSRAIGQLVTADSNVPCGFNLGATFAYAKESRVITLQNARKKITDLCRKLVLSDHCIDMAHNFYKMALMKKFTQGRRSAHVIAACVYLVCRQQETPHMLLDISDILQVNVYELGKTYLKLQTELCINTPTIDPTMYILRFSHQLGFDGKVQDVSLTATRLIQRMKRDWMQAGRRPAGLCGAALLVAARMHNFNRTVKDIIKVVKVCQATVRKRLIEFSETPSSRLTLEQFMKIDLEEEQDPPAFKAARKKKLIEIEEQKLKEAEQQVSELQKEIEFSLEKLDKKKMAASPFLRPSFVKTDDNFIVEQCIAEATVETIDDVLQSQNEQGQILLLDDTLKGIIAPMTSVDFDEFSVSDSNMSDTVINVAQTVGVNTLDTTDLDEDDIDTYILNKDEIKAKTEYWFSLNGQYIKEQRVKQEKRIKEEEENAKKEPKKKRQRRKREPMQANTPDEAIEKILQQKRISLKLDYTVLKNLNAVNESKQGEKPSTSVEHPIEIKEKTRHRVYKPKPQPIIPNEIRNGISALVMKAHMRKSVENHSDEDLDELDSKPTACLNISLGEKLDFSSSEEKVFAHCKVMDDDEQDQDTEYVSQDENEVDDDEIDHGEFTAAQLLGHNIDADVEFFEYED